MEWTSPGYVKFIEVRGRHSKEVALGLLTQQPGFDSRHSQEVLILPKFINDT